MSKKISKTRVIRHADTEKEWSAPRGEGHVQAISNHIEKHIGQIDRVYHELRSDAVHVDIHHVPPCKDRPLHSLITSGMSDLAMKVPDESQHSQYLELMVSLPEHWIVDDAFFEGETQHWLIHQLIFLARFPHKNTTWLGRGHTIPNGDPAEPRRGFFSFSHGF